MRVSNRAIVVLLAVLVLAGCAGPRMMITYTVPPRIDMPRDIRRIAIGMIDYKGAGNYGEYAANSIAEGIKRRQAELGINRFEVIDRQHMSNLLEEQRLQLSGLTEANVSEYAQLANADVFLVGSINTQVETQQDTVPEEYIDWSTQTVKTRYVPRTIRRGSANLTVTMYDATSRVVASQSYTSSYDSTKEEDTQLGFLESQAATGKKIHSEGEVVDRCISRVVEDFMKDILPYDVTVVVDLKGDGEHVTQGNAYAKANLIDDAAAEFAAALAEKPDHHERTRIPTPRP